MRYKPAPTILTVKYIIQNCIFISSIDYITYLLYFKIKMFVGHTCCYNIYILQLSLYLCTNFFF